MPGLARRFVPCGLLALALAGCGASTRPVRAGTLVARARPSRIPSCEDLHASGGGPRACVIARLDPALGVVEVFLRIEPEALPPARTEVTVAFGDEVRSLGPVTEVVELRTTIQLDSQTAAGSSFRHAAGWHLVGGSFLPAIRVDGEPASIPSTLLLEAGDAPIYSSAGPSQTVFEATSFERLADEAYEVGPIPLTRREVDGDTLWIAGTGRADGELEVSADAVAEAYRHLREALGDPPADSLLIALHSPEGEPWSRRAGTSMIWALPSSPDPEAALVDALAPLVQLFLSSAEPWLAEGVADYLAAQLGAELLELDDRAVARAMLRRAGSPTARDRGALAGFCLDGYLAQQSSSLAAWLGRARGAGPLTSEALLADLGAVLPDAAGYLAALLDPEADLAIDECLERLGLRSETAELDAPTDAALRAALGVASWQPLRGLPVLRVDAVEAGSPLLRGDLLVAVGEHAISDPDDLAHALMGQPVGTQVSLRVRRRGDVSTIAWTLPDFADAERAVRSHVALLPLDDAAP